MKKKTAQCGKLSETKLCFLFGLGSARAADVLIVDSGYV